MNVASTSARARSFDAWADEYEQFRPGYPAALFDLIAETLALPPQPEVADLGAGTGRASLAMAERGWRVTAVEPGEPMLAVLRGRADDAGLSVATVTTLAEETGIDPASLDLVTAAQSFHWFDADRAVAEIARILRPRGGVALFWNVRDERRSDFVVAYHDVLDRRFDGIDTGRLGNAGRCSAGEETRAALSRTGMFESIGLEEVEHEIAMTSEQFIGMAFTSSYVRTQPPEEQDAFRVELEALLAMHAPGGTPFPVPYRVELWTARRAAR